MRGKRSLPNVLTLYYLKMKRCNMKGYQVFFIYVNKIEIESKSNETKEMKVFLDDFKNIFLEEINETTYKRC